MVSGFHFADRTALVTGAASGIGLAIAKALLAEGVRVALADWDSEALEKSVSGLGDHAMAISLDVTDRAAWTAARTAVEARFGTVSILANNAGIGPDGRTIDAMDPANFDRMMAIKVTGTFNGVQCLVPAMKALGSGHVVNTASMAGLIASARLGAYTASKFAVVGLSEVMRAELAQSGIGVSVLCPGLVATNLGKSTEKAGSDRIVRQSTDAGIDPAEVGELVIAGIRANAMHILTHGEYGTVVAERMDRILAAFANAPIQSATSLPGTDNARN